MNFMQMTKAEIKAHKLLSSSIITIICLEPEYTHDAGNL